MLPIEQVQAAVRPIAVRPAAPVFLKWVGGKKRYVKTLARWMPEAYTWYYEPFLGSAAMYLYVRPPRAVLSDKNPHLINLFAETKKNPDAVWFWMNEHASRHTPEKYREVRPVLTDGSLTPTEEAGLFLYLNRACFKGLYRISKRRGQFNVPPTQGTPCYPNLESVRAVSAALKDADVTCRSGADVPIRSGAFYFLDPPYHTTFTGYDRQGFTDDDQRQIAYTCKHIDDAGGKFMLCNSATPFVRGLYNRYRREVLNERLGKNLYRGGRALAEVVYMNY